jgi:hypothetical protein
MNRTHFAHRIDIWDAAGENIIDHVAGVEDFVLACAVYQQSLFRWPDAVITLRQDARIVFDSRRTQVA